MPPEEDSPPEGIHYLAWLRLCAGEFSSDRLRPDTAADHPGFCKPVGLYAPAQETRGMRWHFGDEVLLLEIRPPASPGAGEAAAQHLLAWCAEALPGLKPGQRPALLLRSLQSIGTGPRSGPAPFCYLLGCSCAPGHGDVLDRWYREEHLPALASVPGTLRARRYSTLAEPRRWYALYDLESPEVMRHPQWLANRETAASQVAIPLMRDVERTMLRRIGP